MQSVGSRPRLDGWSGNRDSDFAATPPEHSSTATAPARSMVSRAQLAPNSWRRARVEHMGTETWPEREGRKAKEGKS